MTTKAKNGSRPRSAPTTPPDRGMGEDNVAVAAPLDSLMVDAVFGPLRRFNPGMPGLLGGHTRFVLSTSGHIAALVNPPGNPKAGYRVSDDALPDDPQEFVDTVDTTKGSWWTDFVPWLAEHSGPEKPAPKVPGSKKYEVLAAAPGTYVYAT